MATMTTGGQTPLDSLYASLAARRRPEDVAETIREVLAGELTQGELRTLDRAAKGSLKRSVWGWSSMAQEFASVVGMDGQVALARELFERAYPLSEDQCSNPQAVEALLRQVGGEIGKAWGRSDFKHDRLPAAVRREIGIEYSRRGYNKRFRLLARMEARLRKLVRELKKRGFQMVGKSGLASRLTRDEFLADRDTACFIAYYTAQSNRRSEFILDPQQRPFDEVADMLYRRAKASPGVSWWAIAHVFPHREVFAHLDEKQAGELLGRWFGILQEVAELLRETWEGLGKVNRRKMVVRRGMDSSTWNNTAGAWNKARDNWTGLLYALGMEWMLDTLCPGKVMRLMAADLAYLHATRRSGIDPNTEVWAALPLPWRVLSGEAPCTRAQVDAVCRRVGLDAERTGWTAPRDRTQVAAFRPTPELVHGVAVSNPYLATVLRSGGVFSGKSLKGWAAPV